MFVLISAVASTSCSPTQPHSAVDSRQTQGIVSGFEGNGQPYSAACRWCGYYKHFSNGLPASRNFFPLGLWEQYAGSSTTSGSWGFLKGYPTLAAAAVGMGINTFVGEYDWPNSYGADSDSSGVGFLQAVCNVGDFAIAGGDPGAIVWRGAGTSRILTAGQGARNVAGTFTLTVNGHTTRRIAYNASAAAVESAINDAVRSGTVTDAAGTRLPSPLSLTFASAPRQLSVNYSGVTDTASIASVRQIAARERSSTTGQPCSKFLSGYILGDEPDQCDVSIPADVAAVHAMDSTRLVYESMDGWVTWGSSGCSAIANGNFRATNMPTSADYHDTDSWNTKGCTDAADVSTSPWADCSWLYGYQAAVQTRLAGSEPTWINLESGDDVFAFARTKRLDMYNFHQCVYRAGKGAARVQRNSSSGKC